MVPALVVIVREALAVTSAAESYVVRTGDGARTVALKELAALLADVYRTTQDRAMGDASKKLGTLVVVNGILRLNFRLHSMRACQIYVDPVVRMCGGPGVVVNRGAEAPVLPDPELAMDRFPLSQSVTFAYYQGRLLMLDHKFAVVSERGVPSLDLLCVRWLVAGVAACVCVSQCTLCPLCSFGGLPGRSSLVVRTVTLRPACCEEPLVDYAEVRVLFVYITRLLFFPFYICLIP
jgi:hypothetical protein